GVSRSRHELGSVGRCQVHPRNLKVRIKLYRFVEKLSRLIILLLGKGFYTFVQAVPRLQLSNKVASRKRHSRRQTQKGDTFAREPHQSLRICDKHIELRSPDFFEDQAHIAYSSAFGDVNNFDDVAVRKLGAGADKHILVGSSAVDFLQLRT